MNHSFTSWVFSNEGRSHFLLKNAWKYFASFIIFQNKCGNQFMANFESYSSQMH